VAFIETVMSKRTTRPAIFARCPIAVRRASRPSVSQQIADFLDGRTHGEELLHALYDHVLDEPIPESMRRLLDGGKD
jgi:hypothetical protein